MGSIEDETLIEAGEMNDTENVKPCFDVKYEEDITIECITLNETRQKSPAKPTTVIVVKSELGPEYGYIIAADLTIDERTELKPENDIPSTTETVCEICKCVQTAHKTSRSQQANNVCNECSSNYLPKVVLHKHQLPVDFPQRCIECYICKTALNRTSRTAINEQQENVCNKCSSNYFPKVVLENLHLPTETQQRRCIQLKHTDEKLHKCTACSKKYSNKHRLNQHIQTYHPKTLRHARVKRFECEICANKFSTLYNLDEHRQAHMNKAQNIKRYECHQCGYATHYISNLVRHMKIHSGVKSLMKFKCTICDKQFTDRRYLSHHQRIHLDESEKEKLKSIFKCNICEYSTLWSSGLKQHMKIHADECDMFECNICGKKFFRKGTLKLHVRNHLSDMPFECTICPRKYKVKTSLKYHMETSHVDKALRTVKYQCFICKYSNSMSLGRLQDHMRTHGDDRSFQCSLCPRRFKTKSCRNSHVQVHSGLQYECQICSKKLSSKWSLRIHLETHLDETQRIRKYKCDVCGKAFYKETQLNTHQRSVHAKQEGIFKCNKCSKEFTKSFGIKYHRRMHINYPFDCHFCTRHFSSEQKREIHENAKHKIAKFGRRTFQCYVCKIPVKNRWTLEFHMRKHFGDKPFQCQVCSKGFMLKSVLVSHGRTHLNEKEKEKLRKFKCHLCGYASYDNRRLQIHLLRHTISFACPTCSKLFPTEGRLAYHQRSHTKVYQRKYVCYICKSVVADLTRLRDHMRKHSDERVFHCQICDKRFKHASTLKNHKKTHLDESEMEKLKKFKCHICGYATRNNQNLKRHIFTHVGGEKRFSCTKCPMKFLAKCQLKAHKETHMDDTQRIKKFKCDVCEFAFSHRGNLKRHMNKHSNEKQFACDKCPQKYSDNNSMVKHLRAHIETPNFCTKCPRKFALKTALNEHMRKHKEKLHSCKLCPMKYTMNNGLKRHMRRTHYETKKTLECTICSKKFYEKSELFRHIRTHTNGPKSYECYLCPFNANVIYKLKQHMFQH